MTTCPDARLADGAHAWSTTTPVRPVRSSGSAAWLRALVLVVVASCVAASGVALRATEPAAPSGLGTRWLDTAAAAKVEPGIDLTSGKKTSLLIQAVPGAEDVARRAVVASHGVVGDDLPIVHGFEASISGIGAHALAASPAVRSVSVNHRVGFEEFSYDETTTASNFTKTTEATMAWADGKLGEGVGVAVLDTGVSSMRDFGGRIVFGPDLSGEGSTIDTHGHGTVMAGVVAGNGNDSAGRTGGAFTGVAPKATLVSVKVAGRNGVVDVSTILQAMHWVSAYKNQFNIRVMNLSWGSASRQDPTLDPLNYAVQRLWQQGIVVVVAAGNAGPQAGTITKPADDPLVLTAGAFDDKQNTDASDDSIPSWSSRGPTAAGLTKPDIVAPGRFVTATRSLGSQIEAEYPKALISPSYIRGSGTSEAAAVTSGLVALLLSDQPGLTPDQVKSVLTRSGTMIAGQDANQQGRGRVHLNVARSLAATNPGPASWQVATAGGLGSLEASRGGMNVDTDCGQDGVIDTIKGEMDVRCEAWNGSAWTGSAWTGSAWTGSAWTGSAWTGSAWTGSAWTNASWTGSAWTGGTWTGSAWTGSAWTGSAWTGSAWTGSAWTGSAWTGSAWTGSAWTTAEYDAFTSFGYDDAESEFLTAFWGPRPRAGQRVAGEIAEDHLPGVRAPRAI
ncbi:MAG TPA: S8 family peptidase [Acidimicrobiales bacterium]|nr:S8 family peptidase [Acidimicrobiales bacterium]